MRTKLIGASATILLIVAMLAFTRYGVSGIKVIPATEYLVNLQRNHVAGDPVIHQVFASVWIETQSSAAVWLVVSFLCLTVAFAGAVHFFRQAPWIVALFLGYSAVVFWMGTSYFFQIDRYETFLTEEDRWRLIKAVTHLKTYGVIFTLVSGGFLFEMAKLLLWPGPALVSKAVPAVGSNPQRASPTRYIPFGRPSRASVRLKLKLQSWWEHFTEWVLPPAS